jgi:chromosome segregation ATPase
LTNKQNEFTRHKEEYETAYAELAKQSETALQEVQNKTTRIIKELNDEKQKLIEEIDKNNLVITKLQENKIINEKTLKQLEAENIKKAEENAELTKQVMKFELLQEADAKTFTKLNTQIKELENTIDVKNNEIKNLEKRTIIAETKKDDLEVNSSKNYELYRNTEQKLIQLEEKYDKMQDMENTYKLTIEQLKKELVQAERDNKLLQGAKQHMLDTKEIKERKSTVADILNGSNDAKQVRKKANE